MVMDTLRTLRQQFLGHTNYRRIQLSSLSVSPPPFTAEEIESADSEAVANALISQFRRGPSDLSCQGSCRILTECNDSQELSSLANYRYSPKREPVILI